MTTQANNLIDLGHRLSTASLDAANLDQRAFLETVEGFTRRAKSTLTMLLLSADSEGIDAISPENLTDVLEVVINELSDIQAVTHAYANSVA